MSSALGGSGGETTGGSENDLLRLEETIELGHPLVRLAPEIDWGFSIGALRASARGSEPARPADPAAGLGYGDCSRAAVLRSVQRIDLGAALPVILQAPPHRRGEQISEASPSA